MFFMFRTLTILFGIFMVVINGTLFAETREKSGAYLMLTHRAAPPRYLYQQLRLPDGRIYRNLPTSTGIFVAWTPDGTAFFNHRNDGLYIYNIRSQTNRLVVETPVHQRSPLSLQYLPNTIEIASDGKRFLFRTQATVHTFDFNGKNPRQLFQTGGEISSISWDGKWANIAYSESDGEWRRQKVNVDNPSQRQVPLNVNKFEFESEFGIIEMDLPNWRIRPGGSDDRVLLHFPEGDFVVSGWLTEAILLISERSSRAQGHRTIHLMNIENQQVTEVAQFDDVWTGVQGFVRHNILYLLYGTTGGFVAYNIPLNTMKPVPMFRDCGQLRFIDSNLQETRQRWDQTVDTVFCAKEKQSTFSFHRYDLASGESQQIFVTPGIAGTNYFDLSPDLRYVIVGYQDLGHRTDYDHHLVSIDLNTLEVRELAPHHNVSGISPLYSLPTNVEVLGIVGMVLVGLGLFFRR